jgi:TolB-like protein
MKVYKWLRIITFLAITSIIFSGCATERNVIGNTFQSSYPKMNVQVDPQFKYLGKQTFQGMVKGYQTDRAYAEEREWQIFIPKDAKDRIDKAFYIQIAKTQYNWVNTLPDNKDNLDYGIMKINNESYQYYSRIEIPNTSSSLTKYIMDSGYALPTCIVRRGFTTYPYRDLQVTINYLEDAASSGMSCNKNMKPSAQNLSDNQRNYLSELHKRALAVFGMSESGTTSPSLLSKQGMPKTEIPKSEPTLKATVKPELKQGETPRVIVRGEKVKVGIIEFQNLNEEAKKENLGAIFSEMLTTSFVNSEAFKITEREQLRKVAQELQLSQSGIIDVTQAKQIGKIVGADAIITGSVTKIGSDLRLDARIIDVQSGIILTAEKIIGKTDLNSISSMADGIVDSLVNKFYRDKKS